MTAPDSTSPAAPPGVCPRCAGTHAEDDAETGERLPCTVCFGMPLRPAGLDLDAIEALWRRACDLDTPVAVIASWRDVPLLLAEARRLRGLLDATAQAYDDLVAQVWRATGRTHEPPASTEALVSRVAEEHKTLVGFRAAMLDVHEALDGVRPEPDFDMPAELGSYACDEVARLKAAVLPAGHVAVDRALYEAACRLAADVPRLQREVAAARREGAEAMREACAEHARTVAGCHFADAIRALPLPGGEP